MDDAVCGPNEWRDEISRNALVWQTCLVRDVLRALMMGEPPPSPASLQSSLAPMRRSTLSETLAETRVHLRINTAVEISGPSTLVTTEFFTSIMDIHYYMHANDFLRRPRISAVRNHSKWVYGSSRRREFSKNYAN